MKTKYKVIIASAVVIILAGASIYSIAAEKLPQYRKIVVASAGRTSMRQTLSLKGYIEPNAKQEIQLDISQKVEEVYVQEGQAVKAGDVLLKLDDADMVYKLKSEELNLRALQSQLSELIKSENKDKKDLEYSVTQAEIQYRNSVNDLNEAKIKYEQDQKLYQEGFISKAELDSSAKSLSRLEDSRKLNEIQLDKAKEANESYASQRLQQV
ncbi:MAG: HlyD family efflux transporter periplasmic adaptor subunit, partial [Clostridia bacterium]|nr:HlyD family efflux transporter periplasmic adaptor subunit [Clostridia bacterium]